MIDKLSFTEIIGEAARIFRLHFAKIILLVLLIVLPVSLLQSWIMDVIQKDNSIVMFQETFRKYEGSTEEELNAASEEIYSVINEAASRLMPYTLVYLLAYVLSLAFTAAVIRLTFDEGRHGALSLNYKYGDITVINEHSEELHDVGSAVDYLTVGIKALPRLALTMIVVIALTFLGFMLFLVPGLIIALLGSLAIYTTVIINRGGFKTVATTVRIVFAHPAALLYYVARLAISSLLSWAVSMGASGLFLLTGIEVSGAPAIIANTVILSLVSLPVAFLDVAVTVALINRIDKMKSAHLLSFNEKNDADADS